MSEPFLGQISIFAFEFPPKGWALCNGQLLSIAQNQALFALLGTTYGGDARTTFALPDLRSRLAMHMSPTHTIGEHGGQEAVTLTVAEMAKHSHAVQCNTSAGTQTSPAGNFWWQDSGFNAVYSTVGGNAMAPGAITPTGGGQPHNNVAPVLAVSYCIALAGIFPSRD